MDIKRIVFALLFVEFAVLTGFAAFSEPPIAIWEAMTGSGWSLQMTADLVIAFCFGAWFIHRDAKEHGIRPLPWVIAVFLTGSLALLAYGVRRSFARRDRAALRAIAQEA